MFFDNLQVTHIRGPILEETHYYPFGLTMAGISSKALEFGEPANKYKFISQLLDDDLGVNLYQMRFRNHDPQIGRFIQIDPIADYYVHNSTYAYAENDVIRAMDLEGLEKYVTIDKKVKSNALLIERTVYRQLDSKGNLIDQELRTGDKRLTQGEEMYRVDNVDNIDDKGTASRADKFIAREGIKEVDKNAGTSTVIEYDKGGKEFAETRAIKEGEKIITSKGIVLPKFTTGSSDVNETDFVFKQGLSVVSTALKGGKNIKLGLFVEVNPKDIKTWSDMLNKLKDEYSNLTIQVTPNKKVKENQATFSIAGTSK